MMHVKSKKAFSMVTAIFVIVIMAVVSSLIMNMSSKTLKATTVQYQKEQATLLARSYTELAIMYVLHYDRNTTVSCLETISDHFGPASPDGYDIKMNLYYIGNSTLLSGCNNTLEPVTGTNGTWTNNFSQFDKTISLVVDTYVSYKDYDDPSALASVMDRNITYHRKTLQKL
jgi:type II secretory pathway pseudopilin PulG